MFSIVAALIYIHTKTQQSSLFIIPSPTLFVDFVMIAILTCVRSYTIVVLMCTSLKISDIEHCFMCLLDLCMSSLSKYLYRSSAHCLSELFGFLVLIFKYCNSLLHLWKWLWRIKQGNKVLEP